MNYPDSPRSSRREFLTGRSLRRQAERGGEILADALTEQPQQPQPPEARETLRLETRAMACDFAVVMNTDARGYVPAASEALQRIHALESLMTVYREDSELSKINARAVHAPVPVDPVLFEVLSLARRIAEHTGGAFDPTSGPLIALWKRCRQQGRIPTPEELQQIRRDRGIEHVELNAHDGTVRYHREGLRFDLGGIGKGYALDRAAEELTGRGLTDFLFHGGHSSLLARGVHTGCAGWPVGIRNPLFPKEHLATIVLKDAALSTSGSGVQFFRHAGKRYGHILDPRSGMPAEEMLSVTVIAPTAAEADALSTAFFVMGLENARRYCDNHREIGAVLIAAPARGRTLEPVLRNIPEDAVFFEESTGQ